MIPADAWPAGDRLEWHDDATRTFHDFANETTRPYTAEENAAADTRTTAATAETNRTTLQDRARTAMSGNRTYLAIASPTAAQNTAQIKALTRQVNTLIRLELDELTGTD